MHQIDNCAQPKNGQPVVEHRRELDGTVHAFTCQECNHSWKVYQNQYHSPTCSWHTDK